MKGIDIFYSWQSDLPKDCNQNGIRISLSEACTKIEAENSDIRINIDEATRGTTGAVNIPQTIFGKIRTCDVFICDITTINKESPGGFRKVPNPNVLIELGFAVSQIGWKRIILLFNKEFGSFPDDMPFDIDRHRTKPFSIKSKEDNSGKGQLRSDLTEIISEIIEKNPLKEYEKKIFTDDEIKRNKDIENIKWILTAFHLPSIDNFLGNFPNYIFYEFIFFYETFKAIFESSLLHIYNPKIKNYLEKLKFSWFKVLCYEEHFYPSPDNKYFMLNKTNGAITEKSITEVPKMIKDRERFKSNYNEFIAYIRENYLEIDVDKISIRAYENYLGKKEKP